MSAQHEKVEALFHQALKLSPAERLVFLAGACGSDAGLGRQLEGLLNAEAKAGAFLPESSPPNKPPPSSSKGWKTPSGFPKAAAGMVHVSVANGADTVLLALDVASTCRFL